jgi:hypothetical protein
MMAINSLLGFYKDFGVVAHDEGSFTRKDKALLEKYIKGIQIIPKKLVDKKMGNTLK